MFRFLLTRRWIGFILAVIVMSTAAVQLGRWQFHRLDERKARNVYTEHALQAAPVAADTLLKVGSGPNKDQEWQQVTATGQYDDAQTILVIFRTRKGASGVDVVTPLVLPNGNALLVDRGWWQTNANVNSDISVPDPPEGTVTITGWVRRDSTGGSDETKPVEQKVRSISSQAIAPALAYPVYGGFIDLEKEDPAPAEPLAKAEPPELNNGPHFFYGLQWFFFALLAAGGMFYFAWLELQDRRAAANTGTPPGGATTSP